MRQNSKRVDNVPASRQPRASLPESQQITASASGYQQGYQAILDNRPPPYASVSNWRYALKLAVFFCTFPKIGDSSESPCLPAGRCDAINQSFDNCYWSSFLWYGAFRKGISWEIGLKKHRRPKSLKNQMWRLSLIRSVEWCRPNGKKVRYKLFTFGNLSFAVSARIKNTTFNEEICYSAVW